MQKKTLGNSDLSITRIGFGAWAIGGSGWEYAWGAQDDSDSVKAILKALELGINWIDTAAVYGLGHSEEVVAKALKEWNGEKPYVFTKCALVGDKEGKVNRVLKKDSIIKECEQSLKRLNTDVIDLYQIHWPNDTNMDDNIEAWETLIQLKKEGKVKYIGVSNFNKLQLENISKLETPISLQPPYSLLNRNIEPEVLPYCKNNNIGVIVYSPMASGMLTGAMTRERINNMPDDDWRKKSWDFTEPRLSKNLDLVEKLKEIAKQHNSNAAEISIAWTLLNPAVTAAIVGARNADQVSGFLNSVNIQLNENDVKELENYL